MKRSRFSEERIIGILKEHEACLFRRPLFCRKPPRNRRRRRASGHSPVGLTCGNVGILGRPKPALHLCADGLMVVSVQRELLSTLTPNPIAQKGLIP